MARGRSRVRRRLGSLRAQEPGYRLVGLEEAKEAYNAHSALFIDARSFEKYRQGTIMRALNVPLKRFKRMKLQFLMEIQIVYWWWIVYCLEKLKS